MMDFSFKIIDETKINIEYKYGSEFFNFNLMGIGRCIHLTA